MEKENAASTHPDPRPRSEILGCKPVEKPPTPETLPVQEPHPVSWRPRLSAVKP